MRVPNNPLYSHRRGFSPVRFQKPIVNNKKPIWESSKLSGYLQLGIFYLFLLVGGILSSGCGGIKYAPPLPADAFCQFNLAEAKRKGAGKLEPMPKDFAEEMYQAGFDPYNKYEALRRSYIKLIELGIPAFFDVFNTIALTKIAPRGIDGKLSSPAGIYYYFTGNIEIDFISLLVDEENILRKRFLHELFHGISHSLPKETLEAFFNIGWDEKTGAPKGSYTVYDRFFAENKTFPVANVLAALHDFVEKGAYYLGGYLLARIEFVEKNGNSNDAQILRQQYNWFKDTLFCGRTFEIPQTPCDNVPDGPFFNDIEKNLNGGLSRPAFTQNQAQKQAFAEKANTCLFYRLIESAKQDKFSIPYINAALFSLRVYLSDFDRFPLKTLESWFGDFIKIAREKEKDEFKFHYYNEVGYRWARYLLSIKEWDKAFGIIDNYVLGRNFRSGFNYVPNKEPDYSPFMDERYYDAIAFMIRLEFYDRRQWSKEARLFFTKHNNWDLTYEVFHISYLRSKIEAYFDPSASKESRLNIEQRFPVVPFEVIKELFEKYDK